MIAMDVRKPKQMHLYLIRHGETAYNADKDYVGGISNFLELTERGKRQAAALGLRLKEEGKSFDYVYSSPASRALNTALIATNAMEFGCRINLREELHEISQGDFEGKKRS